MQEACRCVSFLAAALPHEMFGRSRFPAIGELPYFLTLGPHGFYWFELTWAAEEHVELASGELPETKIKGDWHAVFRGRAKSTLQSAIGIRHPVIVQRAQGFMGGSFNTREFFHGRSVEALRTVKWFFLAAGFCLPAAMLLLLPTAAPVLLTAFSVQLLGLLAERWFFFAQANHPQNLYYQAIS